MTITPHSENHLLLIPGSLEGGNFARLKALPGYFRWLDRNVIIRVTGANLLYINNEWPEAAWIGGAEEVRAAWQGAQISAEEVARAKIDPNLTPDDSGYQYQRQPMAHQRRGFALSRDKTAFGLFMEQGTGKTKVIIDTACYLYGEGKIDMLVVVAWPNGVHRNWVDNELEEDMSVPYMAAYWSSNHDTKTKRRELRKVTLAQDCLRVFTFNVEAFTSPHAQEFILELLRGWRCLLVIDQSASIKNPEALRTKFLINKCSQLAPYRRVLDGQPVAEGADELYAQFKFLDPMIIGHDTWTGFKAEFCVIGYWNEIKGYKNLPELHRRIDGHSFRVLEKDCLDLPPRVYKRWDFDLSGEEQRIFDELKLADITTFQPTTLEGEEEGREVLEEHLAMVKNLRLQQIASGWWPQDGTTAAINPKLPSRAKALLGLLQATEGKALIFSRFRPDLELLQKLLGKEAVSYHGGVKENDRAEAKRRFMQDPTCRWFIGQPRSAGIGHTLTAAKHVIFYCNDPSLRLREECEKRAHRKGLKETLLIWDLIARGAHDIAIVRSLRAKKDLANTILQDPSSFFLQHA